MARKVGGLEPRDADGMNAGDGWSAVAAEWASLWGGFAAPARDAVLAATGIGAGSRVLDIGCGSGEFLALAAMTGARVAGIDPAPGMLAIAREAAPGADLRLGQAERLPWPDASFDVVTAFNALQFADDTLDALAEAVRVTEPGGLIAVVNWAERALNDIDTIEAALAVADGEEPVPDGDLRPAGGLESLFAEAGLELVAAELIELDWTAPDDDGLVRGVLLGEDEPGRASFAPVVLEAARPFRDASGGYRLRNAFRLAIARTPSPV
jgi:SAM-dependent methyltransferase